MRKKVLAALTCLATTLSGCSGVPHAHELTIFATTGYLADAAANIAPNAHIITMVGPGGDPHTYQPTTKDIIAMKNADVVLWNGLHLEAQMVKQLESLGKTQLAVGERLNKADLLPWPGGGPDGEALYDPHIWNSPSLWSQVVAEIGDKLASADNAHASEYEAAAAQYEEKISQADAAARQSLEGISPRILITGHDAFNYFGKTYNLEIHATDFVSSEATRTPQQISELADLIASEKVPVIFQDNQANPQAITALKEAVNARGWQVKISDEELFADTLGTEPGTNTYIDAFTHNAKTVGKALHA